MVPVAALLWSGCGLGTPGAGMVVHPPDWSQPKAVSQPWFTFAVPGDWTTTELPAPGHPGWPGEVYLVDYERSCNVVFGFREETDPAEAVRAWKRERIDALNDAAPRSRIEANVLRQSESTVPWAGQDWAELVLDTHTGGLFPIRLDYRLLARRDRDRTLVLAQSCWGRLLEGSHAPAPFVLDVLEPSFALGDAEPPVEEASSPPPDTPPEIPAAPAPSGDPVSLRPRFAPGDRGVESRSTGRAARGPVGGRGHDAADLDGPPVTVDLLTPPGSSRAPTPAHTTRDLRSDGRFRWARSCGACPTQPVTGDPRTDGA